MVDNLSTTEDVERMAFFCSGIPSIVSSEKFEKFLAKVSALIDSGLLDPNQAKTNEEFNSIIASLIRVSALKLRKKSHFFISNDVMIKVLTQFEGHVDKLADTHLLLLSRVMLRSAEPATMFNEITKRIKAILSSPKFNVTQPLYSDLLFIASKLKLESIPLQPNLIDSLDTILESISLTQVLTVFSKLTNENSDALTEYLEQVMSVRTL